MNDPSPPSRLPSLLLVGLLGLLALGLAWYFRPMPDNAPVESLSSTPAYEFRDEGIGIVYLPRRAAEGGAAAAQEPASGESSAQAGSVSPGAEGGGEAGSAVQAGAAPAPGAPGPAAELQSGGAPAEAPASPGAPATKPALGRALIFYPGARVPPEAYAWLGAGLAARGHPVFIARFPLNMAIFAPARAGAIQLLHPEFAGAVLGGHSLGGAMAAAWAGSHPGAASGLLLLAAWAPASAKLAGASLPTLLLSASEDGLATEAKIAKNLAYLPKELKRVIIQGGNHAQFGEYGSQAGDGQALIEGGRQRALSLEAVLAFLEGGGE